MWIWDGHLLFILAPFNHLLEDLILFSDFMLHFQALVKRSSQSAIDANDNMSAQSPFSMDNVLPSSLRRRMSGTTVSEKPANISKVAEQVNKAREALCKQVEGCKELLLNHLVGRFVIKIFLLRMFIALMKISRFYLKVLIAIKTFNIFKKV